MTARVTMARRSVIVAQPIRTNPLRSSSTAGDSLLPARTLTAACDADMQRPARQMPRRAARHPPSSSGAAAAPRPGPHQQRRPGWLYHKPRRQVQVAASGCSRRFGLRPRRLQSTADLDSADEHLDHEAEDEQVEDPVSSAHTAQTAKTLATFWCRGRVPPVSRGGQSATKVSPRRRSIGRTVASAARVWARFPPPS